MWLNKMVVMVNMITMNNHIVFIWSYDSNHGIFWQSPMVTMVTMDFMVFTGWDSFASFGLINELIATVVAGSRVAL